MVFLLTVSLGSRGLMAQQTPEFFTEKYNGSLITYQVINGFAVVEGDMIIGEATVQTGRDGRKRTATLHKYHPESNSVNLASELWPKVSGVVTIPYSVTAGGSYFMPAISAFNSLFAGQINWVPRTNQRNYVDINLANQSLNACFATRGFVGGKEVILGVAKGCGLSANLHEMGHIIGFSHEQSRQNRNSYISIDSSNIAPASQSQYSQDFSNSMDLGLYDYGSLMHYGPRGFSRNGNPEMESIPIGIPFGDPPTFSQGDIDAVNRLYFTTPTKVTVNSLPAGLQIIVDGATYTAPQTFSWALNSTHTFNVPSGPQSAGGSPYLFGRWNSDVNGDLNPSRTVTITPGSGMLGSPASAPANTVYPVNYIQLVQFNPTFVLDNFTVSNPAPGSVSTNPAPQSFAGIAGQFFVSRQLVTLTASPAAGNTFYDYEGGSGGQTFGPAMNPLTFPSDLLAGTFYVDFASKPEVLVTTSITNNNASGTTVAADGGNASQLPMAYSQGYASGWGPGTTHSLTAATPVNPFNDADTVYTFTGWTDGFTSPTRSVTVPASGVLSVGANYSTSYKVTANVNSACAGTVTATPVPANGLVASGTPLTFAASPIAPFVFAGWGGQYTTVNGSTNPINVTATGEVIGTANFNLISAPLVYSSASPSSLPVGSPAQSVTITGTGFTAATAFYLNNGFRDVTYVSPTTITVALLASDFASPGALATLVENLQSGCPVDAYGPSFLVTP